MIATAKNILILFVLLIIILYIFWSSISTGRIKEYLDETGNEIPNSLSEKSLVEINGVSNGFFINSRDLSNPVLLFVSSGPGTDDYFFNEKYKDMHLDDIFTIVYWDYRGMGIAYDSEINPEEITTKVLVEDTKKVTEYLKTRFKQDKIYIMGFSGGTNIAIRAVQENPEDYYAYIGMAQVVTDSSERDTQMYEFMKSRFEERKQHSLLKKLDKLVSVSADGQITCKDWYSYVYLLHKAGGGTTYNETEFWGIDIPIMMSHCYTISEKFNYIRGMKMYRKTTFYKEMENFDYRDSITRLGIPAFFLSGEYDYNCPWPLVREYCEKLEAPEKDFYLIKNAAHSPLWENASDSFQIMGEIKERTQDERQLSSW